MQQNLCLPPNTEYPPHPKHTVPIPTAPFCADTEDEHVDINHCSSSTSQHPHPPAGPFCSCPPPKHSVSSPSPFCCCGCDSRVQLSWCRFSSRADSPYFHTETFRKAGVCVRKHQVFAQRQINTMPGASNPKLIFAALGNYC